MHTKTSAVLVAVYLVALACATPAAAQRPGFSYDVVVETPGTVERTLRGLLQEGRTCAAVARPVGLTLSNNIAVIVSQPPRSATGATGGQADVRVVTATAGTVDELEVALNAAAAQGFRVCGLTLTAAIWGQPSAYAVVAVLARADAAPTDTAYRVVRSRGRREDWALLERAAAEGFLVSRLVSRPDPGPVNTSDIVFVAEKSPGSRPATYALAFAGNGPALQKDIDKLTATGHCVQATWSTSERMTVLLSKPADATCGGAHEYEVEESSRFTVSATDGRLLGLHRIKDGVMALYDGRDRSLEYSLVESVLGDSTARVLSPLREHRPLREKLDVDGGRGYQILDVTWRDTGAGDTRDVDVILSRTRQ
jgi:hypothetical protein